MGGISTDHRRALRAGASGASKRSAKNKQCPVCEKKNAVNRHVDGDFVLKKCRYCDYEYGYFMGNKGGR